MKRILELDYLKGILILLVISFHLVYFEQLHPYAKQVVYTFHMPGFLLISGYLMNIAKSPRDFLRTLLWLFIPYIIMESGYTYMASLLPINEHIDHLTPMVFLDRLLLHPLGPYWYLHTLIICGGIYYIIHNSKFIIHNSKLSFFVRLLLIGIAYYAVSYILGTLLPLKGVGGTFAFSSSLYFLAGAAIRQSGKDFLTIFTPFKGNWGILSPIIFALLIIPHFSFFSFHFSFLIVYFAISSLLYIFHFSLFTFHLTFLGRNSLPLYIFSPIFTILCKRFVPYLQFDPTGLIFLFVSLIFCVAGSLAIAWTMDKTGISKYFFGRRSLS